MSDASNSQMPGYDELMRGEPGAIERLDAALDAMSEDELLAMALKTIHDALLQLADTAASLESRLAHQNARIARLESAFQQTTTNRSQP